jgi:transposase
MITPDSSSTDLRQALAQAELENRRLQQALVDRDRLLQLKDEQIRLLNFRLFGPKAEKLSPQQIQLLFQEVSVMAGEVEQEAQRPQAQKSVPQSQAQAPRSHHPGREPLPEHLERREELLPCCPEDCRCAKCGAQRPVIGYETREELAYEPAKFWVRVIKREKRGSHCLDEQGVATAPAPAQIVPKGKLSNDFIIEVLVRKYQLHLPVYRQCAALLEDFGIDLNRKTLNDAILAAGDLLRPVVKAMRLELLSGSYIQADETTMPCQTGERTGRNHRAFIWEFSRPGNIVIFEFQMGRSREGPQEFLKGFRGKLQSDGYSVYDKLGEGIVYVACAAHIRRGFVDAAKVAPLDPLPPEILARFGELYAVEKEARQGGVSPEARLALRQAKSVPIMAALKSRLTQIRQQLTPGSKLIQACDYALGQWSRLEEYLKDGHLECDNNQCEGSLRSLVLGRKNWLHVGSAEAGPKIAAIASIVETCRRLDINLRDYLRDVLPTLGECSSKRVGELTPTAWKAAQAKKS